jgi:polysaccharide biosynthesis protein PelC
MSRTCTRLAAFLLAAMAVGCAAKGAKVTYHDSNMDFSLVQTVAVMPFSNLTTNTGAGDRVRDVVMTMLQATGSVYVIPPGEVARGISRSSVAEAHTPTPEEAVALCKMLKADAVLVGTVREYGEVRSGTSSANVISLSLSLMEAQTGRVVWSASSTKGGVGAATRLFGGGGQPMDVVTEDAVDDLIEKLFKK